MRGGLTAVQRGIFDNLETDLVFLGSSRARHHYVPSIFKDTLRMLSFNCGLDGNGIVSMYGIYKILSSRKSPRVVVYDLHELFDIQTNDNSKYLASLKMAYDHDCIDSIFWDISPNERIKMRSNLYRYNSMLLPILSDYFSPHETYNYGYSPLKGTMKYVKKMMIGV